ncbi:MAG: PAS domain S-box protein, partial [Polaromonas sp.]|nr:PAS domain S-box protein [Gemmatimonadaceae bacterium]
MPPALRPQGEAERQKELRAYRVLDTAPDPAFDGIVRLAAYVCRTPMAGIALVDDERQWFKARFGVLPQEMARDVAFCAHTILRDDVLVVPDAAQDARFTDNPFVTGEPHVRFYTGVPLTTPGGHAIGSLAVFDHEPRNLSDEQLDALRVLGRQVMAQLELRKRAHDEVGQRDEVASGLAEELRASEERYRNLVETSDALIWTLDLEGRLTFVNQASHQLCGLAPEEMVGRLFTDFVPPDRREQDRASFLEAMRTGKATMDYTTSMYHADGRLLIVRVNSRRVRDAGG